MFKAHPNCSSDHMLLPSTYTLPLCSNLIVILSLSTTFFYINILPSWSKRILILPPATSFFLLLTLFLRFHSSSQRPLSPHLRRHLFLPYRIVGGWGHGRRGGTGVGGVVAGGAGRGLVAVSCTWPRPLPLRHQ